MGARLYLKKENFSGSAQGVSFVVEIILLLVVSSVLMSYLAENILPLMVIIIAILKALLYLMVRATLGHKDHTNYLHRRAELGLGPNEKPLEPDSELGSESPVDSEKQEIEVLSRKMIESSQQKNAISRSENAHEIARSSAEAEEDIAGTGHDRSKNSSDSSPLGITDEVLDSWRKDMGEEKP